MKIKIHTYAYDEQHNGTGCEVFTSKQALHARQREILEGHIENDDGDTAQIIRGHLSENDIDSAWAHWEENFKDPLHTHSIDEHEIEVPDLPAVTAFLDVWSDPVLLDDVGPRMTCTECEAFAEFLTAFGHTDSAQALRLGHSLEDEEGDHEEHLKIKAAYEAENGPQE